MIGSIDHVVLTTGNLERCLDFYTRVLGLEYAMAMAEDRVPSTGEPSPYMHIFFRMHDGSYVAFFEIPESPPMGRDENTPKWVQHLALRVKDMKTLMAYKRKLQKLGLEVIGPTDHTICQSIYFFDPNGHRVELACPDPDEAAIHARLDAVKWDMLEEWSQTRRAPKHAAFLHQRELGA